MITTSWTDGMQRYVCYCIATFFQNGNAMMKLNTVYRKLMAQLMIDFVLLYVRKVLTHFEEKLYYVKSVKTSWTYSRN